ncbi:MarR family winged helix-turn-helix transcriptional regulator [Actinomycetospora sp. NBC_00405]|uniref:MarR family winged helix-turn-helix transcriptional regulator n=1 Tax=Actinomycetospora sp. NBC_00405 TaxID=2975952 RepID=UPI002E246CE5
MPPQPTDRPTTSAGPRADQLAWAVHDLAVAIAEADVAMSAVLGVTPGDYLAVKHVLLRPHELGPAELGRVLGMSSGSATALVDRLVDAGHVVRHPHGRDRRRRVLAVSEASHRRVLHELDKRASEVEELARAHSASEQEAITTFIRALAARHRRRSG